MSLLSGILREVGHVLGRIGCEVGIHEFRYTHPHYCARCGRYYGLR